VPWRLSPATGQVTGGLLMFACRSSTDQQASLTCWKPSHDGHPVWGMLPRIRAYIVDPSFTLLTAVVRKLEWTGKMSN
jgi:hypothetical protein